MKTMNDRVKEVRFTLKKMPQLKFAKMAGMSISSVQKIEAGEMEVSDSSIELLEQNCNVNPNYIKSGKLPMFKDGIVPEVNLIETDVPWKNEAVINLKNEVAFYRDLLMQFARGGGAAPNFLKTLNKAALSNKYNLAG